MYIPKTLTPVNYNTSPLGKGYGGTNNMSLLALLTDI